LARLFEYQAKKLLASKKIPIPQGIVCKTPDEAKKAAEEIGKPVVVKAQLWVTGRKSIGGVRFADTPEQAAEEAKALIGMQVKNFSVEEVLVEEKLDIESEMFAGIIIDDSNKRPLLIFSSVGGTGIEEIAREHPDKLIKHPIDIHEGLRDFEARNLVRSLDIHGRAQMKLGDVLARLYQVAKTYEARSVEVNPLILTKDGNVIAADCHMAVDDYAVFRHPELGIEVARELDHPLTELERIAYRVEASDYRGTFYFFQMESGFKKGESYIGFHGAGGGGSMMSMDAVLSKGFKIANYTDCSGNPPASKVYRAAKIILQQPNLDGYYASGSGVASQEQFHSARGFVKAFREMNLSVPAVIRLGGNQEEKAMEILGKYCSELPAKLEAYGKDDSAVFCAERLRLLVDEGDIKEGVKVEPISNPDTPAKPYSFDSMTGRLTFDHAKCIQCESKPCIEACLQKILSAKEIDAGTVVELNITPDDAKKGRCTECLACEIICWDKALNAIKIELPIEGLG
jgi:succinyl-CoA synthetase beta subunit